VTNISVDHGGAAKPSGPSGEDEVDIEDVVSLAPKAGIYVYETPNTNTGWIDALAKIAHDDNAKVVSISWAGCETGNANAANEWIVFGDMAAQGQSVYAASGDWGSATPERHLVCAHPAPRTC
jgi:kumamolisin